MNIFVDILAFYHSPCRKPPIISHNISNFIKNQFNFWANAIFFDRENNFYAQIFY